MTASLVEEALVSKFRTIEDLRNCRINMSDVCIPAGGAIESIWNTSLASSPCHGSQLPRIIASHDKAIQEVAKKKCRYLVIDSITGHDAITRKYCGKLFFTGEALYTGGISSLVSRNFSYYEEFADATMTMLQEGARRSVDELSERQDVCKVGAIPIIPFRRLKGFFVLVLSACLLFLIWMIIDAQFSSKSNAQESSGGKGSQDIIPAELSFDSDDIVSP